jgi:hypothetical protein
MRAVVAARGGAFGRAAAADDGAEDEAMLEAAGATHDDATAAAKSKLLGKLVKKQVAENVVPLCLGLRAVLAAARSPLQGHLLAFFQVLATDHAEELNGAWRAA